MSVAALSALMAGSEVAASEEVVIRAAKDPVLVQIDPGSIATILTALPEHRRERAHRAASRVVAAIDAYPGRVVALRVRGTALTFDSLAASDQQWVGELLGPNAVELYPAAVAAWLEDVIDAVAAERRHAAISVLGLPVEPQGADL